MVNIEKKHTLRFQTTTGMLEIDTDNMGEVSTQEWFRKFVGVGKEEVPAVLQDEQDWKKVAYEQNEQAKKLRIEVVRLEREKALLKETLRNEVAELKQQVEVEGEKKPVVQFDEKDAEALGKELEETSPVQVQQVPPQPVQPGVRPAQVPHGSVPVSSFLNITQEQMNEQTWASLTTEQQQLWMKHNKLA